jgi:hypothetical protein
MAYPEAMAKSRKLAALAYLNGEYNKAAQLYDHAMRMAQHDSWIRVHDANSPAVIKMRACLVRACRLRDANT